MLKLLYPLLQGYLLAVLGGKLQGKHYLLRQVHVHLLPIPLDKLPAANELSDQGNESAEVLIACSRVAWSRAGPAAFSGSGGGWRWWWRHEMVEWIDQVVGLLGKEMVIEELGMAVVEERESMLALGRLNRRRRGRTFLYLHYLNLPRLKR